ncbi:M48 family metalloprotease [Belliella sp. DSM 111904]|uniref:M48 family metalloprotease n=1 Tax=Belliella filtrata TaxID=2923435 RepID=A0ABS9V641_9BACT|nr:M48 family metallopeptidase [Belliella filtrata]MCH7411398.1 M48 family metalloprotease [Belliella filtrata]
MKIKDIKVSSGFKIQTTKAIYAIALFIFVYLLLLTLAVALTVLCIIGGFYIIAAKPTFITIAIGIALASLGMLILMFLLKFIVKSHKIDRSYLVEITKEEEPMLFGLIEEIVTAIGTDFPKKVYLSNEVNAAVFYDSSFWSMFFPIKKNLQLGMGLINSVSVAELKGIIAHEFGHFSQRSMKVGSYVYHVNQVIFNLVEDNTSYSNLIEKWANISGFFALSASLAVKIILGIQWILKQMYEVVNKNYMGLSREMEFHADEIAAHITGIAPMKTSLLRIPLSDHAFTSTLNYYDGKVKHNIKSGNIYGDQAAVLSFLSEFNQIPCKNGLPQVSLTEQSKFNKSKLTVEDQWSSHPSTEDRLKRLEKTNLHVDQLEEHLATTLFQDIEKTQVRLTHLIFDHIPYEGEVVTQSTADFIEDYKADIESNSFPKVFNGYYDNRNPISAPNEEIKPSVDPASTADALFSDEKVDLVYTAIALENDIDFLNKIYFGKSPIKTFDYDGKKYKKKEINKLVPELKKQLEEINQQIHANDLAIFSYFQELSMRQEKTGLWENCYDELNNFERPMSIR